MVLMAIVDARYRFILADFGTNGRVSDEGVLQNTKFFKKLQNKKFNIPDPENIESSSRCLPYVFVTDDAFPLRAVMLKPYRQAGLNNHEKKIFNYRLSRARRLVEYAFGILSSRFRIYHTQINIEPDKIENIVMATIALHNFLMENVPYSYAPTRCFYHENINNGTVVNRGYDTARSTMEDLQRQNQGNVLNNAKIIRQEYQNYFVNEGKVPWQDNFI
ncbi:Protein ALP1-like [Eumeta japonica]|uniref:Protein ALP1-like n=1 Tax=Eumeta variegata TaxID=151549 RepID=A0A4C1TGB4_EUMVA|nr:Protein ALP1-like [Eumeta japonica]